MSSLVLPSRLVQFHREALPVFELPPLSQKIVEVFMDRDSGAEQLQAATSGMPAAAAWLSAEWQRVTGKSELQMKSVEFWIPRLGMETCRRVWLSHQLGARWCGSSPHVASLDHARAVQEQVEAWIAADKARDPAYADSAFLAGLLFDLLALAWGRSQASGGLKILFEARFKRFQEALLQALEESERTGGSGAKRMLAAVMACGSVSELWFLLTDPVLASSTLSWEAKGMPIEVRRLFQRRILGFNPRVAGAWIADVQPILRPYRDVIRLVETPSALSAGRSENFWLAGISGRASEVG